MTTPTPDRDLDIRDVPTASRFEARYASGDGSTGEPQVAIASYVLSDDTITFEHTLVPHGMEGHHVGARLVQFALDDARARGLRVVATCPFVAAYVARHAEYQDLLR